ncbi:putative bromodomain protein [Trichinella spiralis]|uniref:putative bromodomain protein n=1 Tax=Trichinella spiralis TaxID=6334 RepID=UPI0001EFC87B|nr:putative bromodomain protein [Trichinella spiralis]
MDFVLLRKRGGLLITVLVLYFSDLIFSNTVIKEIANAAGVVAGDEQFLYALKQVMNTFESVEHVHTIIKALKNGYRYMSTKLQQSPILKEFFAKYAVQLKSMPKNDVLITLEFLLREMTSLRNEKITESKALAADAIAEFKRMPDESLLPLIRSRDPHYEFLCQLSEIENAISDAQPAKAVLKLSNLKGEIAALMALKTRQSDHSRLFIECGKVYYCGSGYSVVDMAVTLKVYHDVLFSLSGAASSLNVAVSEMVKNYEAEEQTSERNQKMDVEDEQNRFASVADDEQEPSSVLNGSRKVSKPTENTTQGAQSTFWDSMSDNFRCFARSAAASSAKQGRYMDFKRTSTPKVRMQQRQHQSTGSDSTMDEGDALPGAHNYQTQNNRRPKMIPIPARIPSGMLDLTLDD